MSDEPRELSLHELNEQARAADRAMREDNEAIAKAMADAAAAAMSGRVKGKPTIKPVRAPVTE